MPLAAASSALHFDDAVLAQQAAEQPVHEDVQLDEIDARAHLAADVLLQRVHRGDQRAEVVGSPAA